jgi:acetyl-CoA synthetase
MNQTIEKKEMFQPSRQFSDQACIQTMAQYEKMYRESVDDPEKFWEKMAQELVTWERKWDKVLVWDFNMPSRRGRQGGPDCLHLGRG